MPFKSEKQRKWMWANEPEMAEKWANEEEEIEEQKTYRITQRQLRKIISEVLELGLENGDIILTGRFKNKRSVVKNIGTDDLGQPTVNGMKALSFRIEKLMPKSKWSKKTLEELEEDED
jgi:hypothetical protein